MNKLKILFLLFTMALTLITCNKDEEDKTSQVVGLYIDADNKAI